MQDSELRGFIKKLVPSSELFSLEDITGLMREHVKHAYDLYIPNCGREGKGKSTLGIKVMLSYARVPLDSPKALEMLEKNVRYAENCSAFKALQFYINEAKDGGVYMFDEAERMASKYDSSSIEAKLIRRYWTFSRKRNIVSILNMPMLSGFDIYIRSGRAFMAFVSISRFQELNKGLAVVLLADEENIDAFDLEGYNKAKKKSNTPFYALKPLDRIKLWAKCKSFAGIMLNSPLPPPLEERYLALANTQQQYASLIKELKDEIGISSLYSRRAFTPSWGV